MKRRRKTKAAIIEARDTTTASPAAFFLALTRVAVTQICRSVGFRSGQASAVQSLSLIASKYMEALARSAALYCNEAGRTQSNLIDFLNALQDLSSVQGFAGASVLHDSDRHCLLHSVVLRDLCDFVHRSPEIPFAKPVPRRKDHTPGRPPRCVNPGEEKWGQPVGHHAPPRSRQTSHDKAVACQVNPSSKLPARESTAPPRSVHVPVWLPEFPSMSSEECEGRQSSDLLWENSEPVLKGIMAGEKSGGKCGNNGQGVLRGGGRGGLEEGRRRVRFKLRGEGGGKGQSRIARGKKGVPRDCNDTGDRGSNDGDNHN